MAKRARSDDIIDLTQEEQVGGGVIDLTGEVDEIDLAGEAQGVIDLTSEDDPPLRPVKRARVDPSPESDVVVGLPVHTPELLVISLATQSIAERVAFFLEDETKPDCVILFSSHRKPLLLSDLKPLNELPGPFTLVLYNCVLASEKGDDTIIFTVDHVLFDLVHFNLADRCYAFHNVKGMAFMRCKGFCIENFTVPYLEMLQYTPYSDDTGLTLKGIWESHYLSHPPPSYEQYTLSELQTTTFPGRSVAVAPCTTNVNFFLHHHPRDAWSNPPEQRTPASTKLCVSDDNALVVIDNSVETDEVLVALIDAIPRNNLAPTCIRIAGNGRLKVSLRDLMPLARLGNNFSLVLEKCVLEGQNDVSIPKLDSVFFEHVFFNINSSINIFQSAKEWTFRACCGLDLRTPVMSKIERLRFEPYESTGKFEEHLNVTSCCPTADVRNYAQYTLEQVRLWAEFEHPGVKVEQAVNSAQEYIRQAIGQN